jgi:predicted metal-dependent enzyme (double-stranded beta helix superfamily)
VPSSSTVAPDGRLARFIATMAGIVGRTDDEADLLVAGSAAMAELVSIDDWLAERWARPDPHRYLQNLLYCDAENRFCVVSFVWGPGQQTPVHDHTTWGIIGMLRGAEIAESYSYSDSEGLVPSADPVRLQPGDIDAVSPDIGDIHQVRNAFDDRASVSIHAYGANIGRLRRSSYLAGTRSPFVSGYSNAELPNPWAAPAAAVASTS